MTTSFQPEVATPVSPEVMTSWLTRTASWPQPCVEPLTNDQGELTTPTNALCRREGALIVPMIGSATGAQARSGVWGKT